MLLTPGGAMNGLAGIGNDETGLSTVAWPMKLDTVASAGPGGVGVATAVPAAASGRAAKATATRTRRRRMYHPTICALRCYMTVVIAGVAGRCGWAVPATWAVSVARTGAAGAAVDGPGPLVATKERRGWLDAPV